MYRVDCGERQTVLRLNSTEREVIFASHLEATDLMSVQESQALSCICTLLLLGPKDLVYLNQLVSLSSACMIFCQMLDCI